MPDSADPASRTRTLAGQGKGLVPERRMVGNYVILATVAQGGMGVVYRVSDPKLKREVALKMMLGGAWSSPDAQQRFLREADLLADLSHPGIVPVHDKGLEQGAPWYTMDLVEGKTLDRTEGELSRKLKVFSLACEAVHYAHSKGVIHRDLKPANILVKPDGQPVVLDFGIARMVDQEGLRASLMTQSGVVMGTPAYMAPEQAQGHTKDIDIRTDVYALGVILYEMVTGKLPFQEKETFALLKSVVEGEPTRPSVHVKAIPGDLEAVILKAMAKEPARRYATALELARDVDRFLKGEAVQAHPDSAIYRVGKWMRRHKELTAAAAVLLVGGAWAVWGIVKQRDRAIVAEREAIVAKTLAERKAGDEAKARTEAEATARILANKEKVRNLIDEAIEISVADSDKALGLLKEALVLDEKNSVTFAIRSTIFRKRGQLAECERDLRDACALTSRTDVAVQLGQLLVQQGRWQEGLDFLDKASSVNAFNFGDGALHACRGRALLGLRRYPEALATLNDSLESNPYAHQVHYTRGLVLTHLGRNGDALEAFERSLQIEPAYVESMLGKAVVLAALDRQEEAIPVLEAALKLPLSEGARKKCLDHIAVLKQRLGR